MASECSTCTWTSQKTEPADDGFVENTAPSKMASKLYYFIADKSCLLFTIILKVLSGWEVIKTQGKCIKSYKNFLKDFVVEQNLTFLKGNF